MIPWSKIIKVMLMSYVVNAKKFNLNRHLNNIHNHKMEGKQV